MTETLECCLLLEHWFILVAAALRFLFPYWSSLHASLRFWMLIHPRSERNSKTSYMISDLQHTDDRWYELQSRRERLTFNVSVPSAVVTHAQSSALPGLGAQGRLKQIVHALIVDFKE